MEIYGSNDLSKYINKKKPNEIIDEFMYTYRKNSSNSVLNSTAYSECIKSGLYDNSNEKFSINKKITLKEKFNDYKNEININVVKKNLKLEKDYNNRLNIVNLNYNDISSTLPIMGLLKRFKKITTYNNKVQELFTESRSNRINILTKLKEFNKYVNKIN